MKTAILTACVLLLVLPFLCEGAVSYDLIVVRGDMPTDYTVASIYASTKKIPLVLIDPDNIQSQIREELIGYLNKGNRMVLIIGGDSAISRNVENELKAMGFTVNRMWDWNRYGTAGRVSIDLWEESEKVVITNGESYEGFLLAQRIALDSGSPILFVKNSTVPAETRDAITKLGTRSAILIGSTQAAAELRLLGLSVETIETTSDYYPVEGESDETYLYYFFSLPVLLAVLAAFAFLRYSKSRKVSVYIMNEDEEKLVDILRGRGKTEQSKLAGMTGFSKPRISRMLRSLEVRGIIERERYKRTLKIKIKPRIA